MDEGILNINLEEWTATGKGGQGTTYEHKTNPDILLKLYEPPYGIDYVSNEINLNSKLRALGIHTPGTSQLATDGIKYGIIFQKIKNKKSFCQSIADNPEQLEALAKRMANEVKYFHSIPLTDSESYVDSRDFMRNKILSTENIPPRYMKRALKLVEKLPTGKCFCHGDLNFGNYVTDGKEDWVIDMGTFCVGSPELDLANFFHICNLCDPRILNICFHVSRKQAVAFWKCFINEYYDRKISHRESCRIIEIPLAIFIYWSVGVFNLSILKTILKTRKLSFLKYL